MSQDVSSPDEASLPGALTKESPIYWKDGEGAPFIFVPGLDGTGRLFYKQSLDLRRDHTVITYPLRQIGSFGLQDLIGDLIRIIEDAGMGSVVALGESFGGLLLMAAACANPNLFSHLVLVNTFPFFRGRSRLKLGIALLRLVPYSAARKVRRLAASWLLFTRSVESEDRRAFHQCTRDVGLDGYLSRLRIVRDADLRAQLARIDIPTLIVAGTADRLINSAAEARSMARIIPRSRLKLLDGSGHAALLSSDVRVRDWLIEFDSL
jgi:3-oxoadipate enol-lactonase